MSWLQGPPLDNDECDSHEAPSVVVVPVMVESRGLGGPNRNSDFNNKMELRGKID